MHPKFKEHMGRIQEIRAGKKAEPQAGEPMNKMGYFGGAGGDVSMSEKPQVEKCGEMQSGMHKVEYVKRCGSGEMEKAEERHESSNKEWGYHGTARDSSGLGEKDAHEAFHRAVKHLAEKTGHSHAHVKSYLDSKAGRHLADDAHNHAKPDKSGHHTAATLHEGLKLATSGRHLGYHRSAIAEHAGKMKKGEDGYEQSAALRNAEAPYEALDKGESKGTSREAGMHFDDYNSRAGQVPSVRTKGGEAGSNNQVTKREMEKCGEVSSGMHKVEYYKMRKSAETKHDRCVEDVEREGGASNPHAVCTAAGVPRGDTSPDKE